MEHVVEIYYKSMLSGKYTDTDIGDIALSACARLRLLGMDMIYISVFVDGEEFNSNPPQDISIVRKQMIKVMLENESQIDFGIDHLFEVS